MHSSRLAEELLTAAMYKQYVEVTLKLLIELLQSYVELLLYEHCSCIELLLIVPVLFGCTRYHVGRMFGAYMLYWWPVGKLCIEGAAIQV